MYCCTYCNEKFENKNTLANHVRWQHTPQSNDTSKFFTVCSCICCQLEFTSQNIGSHYQSKHVVKSYCKHCNTSIIKINRDFCSKSCAAKYNNSQKDFSNINTGPAKGTVPSNYYKHTKIKQCAICNKFHPGKGKTCSSKCKSKLISQSLKKTIANTAFNPNNNRGRGKKSYLERSFEEWLLLNFPNVTYFSEHAFRNYNENKTYFADFYFPDLNLVIELDGTQHKKTKKYDDYRDNYISSKYNLTIIRISHQEYVNKSRVSEISALLWNQTTCK